MPAYPGGPEESGTRLLSGLQAGMRGLTSQSTEYVVDNEGVCRAIIGNLAAEPGGTSTGLAGWGIAVSQAGKWAQVAPSGYATARLGAVKETTATTYAALPGGPSLSIPSAGVWQVELSIWMESAEEALNQLQATLALNGSELLAPYLWTVTHQIFDGGVYSLADNVRLDAGDVLTVIVANTQAHKANYSNARIAIQPVSAV